MTDFHGKATMITGGASGIGKETARQLVARGGQVLICDLQEEAGQALAAELGDAAAFQKLDVSDEVQWMAAMLRMKAAFGRLDGLVNGAGIPGPVATIEDITLESWNRVIGINATGTMLGCKYSIELMAQSGGGSIVNISSVAAMKPWPASFAYGCSKAMVTHLTQAVAKLCGTEKYRIRCNAVHPGPTDTPILEISMPNFKTHDEMVAAVSPLLLMGRLGTVEEIAAPILFLLSDAASFITGANLVADGGYLVQ